MTNRPIPNLNAYRIHRVIRHDLHLQWKGDRGTHLGRLEVETNEGVREDAAIRDGFTAHRLTRVLTDLYPEGTESN